MTANPKNWRAICTDAVACGQAAAIELSAYALSSLLTLPPDRRAALLDAEDDSRIQNLLPADRAVLRASLVEASPKPNAPDDGRADRQRRLKVLNEFITAFDDQLIEFRAIVAGALAQTHKDSGPLTDYVMEAALEGRPLAPVLSAGHQRLWVKRKTIAATQRVLNKLIELAQGRLAVIAEYNALKETCHETH